MTTYTVRWFERVERERQVEADTPERAYQIAMSQPAPEDADAQVQEVLVFAPDQQEPVATF
jgi:hypothetical protein